MPETKPFWKSKTLWFNLLSGLLLFLDQNSLTLQQHLGTNVAAWIAAVVTSGNAILRVVTNQPLSATPAPAEPKK
jgi:hypothetical protein